MADTRGEEDEDEEWLRAEATGMESGMRASVTRGRKRHRDRARTACYNLVGSNAGYSDLTMH